MVRQIVEIKNEEYNLKIPKEYLNRKVEILILPYDIDREIVQTDSNLENDYIFQLVNNPVFVDGSVSFLTRVEANER